MIVRMPFRCHMAFPNIQMSQHVTTTRKPGCRHPQKLLSPVAFTSSILTFSISLPTCASSSLSAALIYIKRHSLQSLSSCIIISSFVLSSCFCRLLSLGAILLSISCFVGKGRGPERAQIADREGAKLSCGHHGSYSHT